MAPRTRSATVRCSRNRGSPQDVPPEPDARDLRRVPAAARAEESRSHQFRLRQLHQAQEQSPSPTAVATRRAAPGRATAEVRGGIAIMLGLFALAAAIAFHGLAGRLTLRYRRVSLHTRTLSAPSTGMSGVRQPLSSFELRHYKVYIS